MDTCTISGQVPCKGACLQEALNFIISHTHEYRQDNNEFKVPDWFNLLQVQFLDTECFCCSEHLDQLTTDSESLLKFTIFHTTNWFC